MTNLPNQNHSKKTWSNLSQQFNTSKKDDEIEESAADNILIAWPVFIDFIKNHIGNPLLKKALDYGCGTGGFCHKLNTLGFNTTGIDFSEGMIEIAKKHHTADIHFFIGDSQTALEQSQKNGQFDFISSIMAFQFIEEIEKTIQDLSKSLLDGGHICFAVFNESWVKECINQNIFFRHLPNDKSFEKVIISFGENNEVYAFNRPSNYYDRIFEKLGFKKILEEYPPFTEEFISKYKPSHPVNVSEFMILGYCKKASSK